LNKRVAAATKNRERRNAGRGIISRLACSSRKRASGNRSCWTINEVILRMIVLSCARATAILHISPDGSGGRFSSGCSGVHEFGRRVPRHWGMLHSVIGTNIFRVTVSRSSCAPPRRQSREPRGCASCSQPERMVSLLFDEQGRALGHRGRKPRAQVSLRGDGICTFTTTRSWISPRRLAFRAQGTRDH